jgi:hypothetical protein
MPAHEFEHVNLFHCTLCWSCILIVTRRQVWQNALIARENLSTRQCGNQYICVYQCDGDCSKEARGAQNH